MSNIWGIITATDKEIAETARSYINIGRSKGGGWYEHVRLGTNLRLTEIRAAILLGQLKRLKKQTLKRQENALYLDTNLKDIPGIILTKAQERATIRSYHLYMLRFIQDKWGIPGKIYCRPSGRRYLLFNRLYASL